MNEDHPLLSLVYTSSAAQPFSETELSDLLRDSRTNNRSLGVTGLLLHRDGEFVQILEGTRDEVGDLMARIAEDRRHRDVRVLLEEPLHERRFPQWTMGYESLASIDETPPEGYRDSFDDLRMGDHDMIGRALMELTMWFRVRETDRSLGA
ncbi:BLUF domain-containing protein [Microbacterium sp. 1.5R]|uniref:BLUF domain-containing protein n=1 Tax=Microbacterium sp. 1.5R TaxID=1916917 RepID=UPI00119E2A66|nr:BLUF domain-containing protein [Microbacterium sp. 1.5R]